MTTERDYDALFREAGVVLWRTMYTYSGGRRHIADDAVAEAFVRALEHDREIRAPLPWLYRTAFRIAAAEMRREGRLDQLGEESIDPPELIDLVGALRRLSPNQRAAVFLHYQADLPVSEVARLIGTSVAAVKVHLFRGRRKLRELLGGDEGIEEGEAG